MAGSPAMDQKSIDAILSAFQDLDTESTGLIPRADLKTVLKTIDADMWSDEAVDSLFAAVPAIAAGDGEAGVPYREFVAAVFAGSNGDANPLALGLPQTAAGERATASAAAARPFQEHICLLKTRLLRLTAGEGKDKAETLAALCARVEEHAAKGGDLKPAGRRGARVTFAPSYVSEAFACYDVDGSGCLDIQELASLAQELGVAMDKSEVARTFQAIDTTGSNSITLPEFCAFMQASEGSGSVSQGLRLKLWNRKFDRAAKALRETMKKHENKGKLKSEADEAGELVVRVGDPMEDAPLRLKSVATFEAAEPRETGEDEEPSEDEKVSFKLKLKLKAPGGLQDKAAEMNDFLQELVEGPPPGWESATVQRVEGSDIVEVALSLEIPLPREISQGMSQSPIKDVAAMMAEVQGHFEFDLGMALDFQKLAQATAEAPYDLAADARLSGRVSAKTSDDDFLDEVGMFMLAQQGAMPDLDEPEAEWAPEQRAGKHVLPPFLRWASKSKGTVELGSAAPLVAALCDCRGFGQQATRDCCFLASIDESLPDLRKVTAAAVRNALVQFYLYEGIFCACEPGPLRLGFAFHGDPGSGFAVVGEKLDKKRWEYWSAILTVRTLLTVIGFAAGATVDVSTPLGTFKVDADLKGLSGLSALVPSYAELRREIAARSAKYDEADATAAEAEAQTTGTGAYAVALLAERGANIFAKNEGRLENFYDMDKKKIGEGSFAIVQQGMQKCTQAMRAVKMIAKSTSSKDKILREINVNKVLDHPNMCKLFEYFEDHKNVYIVNELCTGGELFDHIIELGHFTESQAAIVMQQMARGLCYMHENHVCHRDIKPENFMFGSKDPIATATLKFIDFGLASPFSEGQVLTTKAGTPYYVAPQVLAGKYDQMCDIWSAGVIMYVLIVGYPPFFADSDAEVLSKVRLGNYSFNGTDWKNVSEDAKNLVRIMLKMNPRDRLTAQQVLNHAWIKEQAPGATGENIGAGMVENLKGFRGHNKFKKAALMAMAHQLSDNEIKNLRETFTKLDVRGNGKITFAELKQGIEEAGLSEIPEELQAIMDGIKGDGSGEIDGEIDYSEFVAATLDKKHTENEDVCWRVFKNFDKNNDGTISQAELEVVLMDPDLQSIATAEVAELLAKYDGNNDGVIDFKEFMALMTE